MTIMSDDSDDDDDNDNDDGHETSMLQILDGIDHRTVTSVHVVLDEQLCIWRRFTVSPTSYETTGTYSYTAFAMQQTF
jgi:hypothetical protein